ncbi:hypothetical protein FB45DRAFT_952782 [Roridomyces roridus]|uniref:F-box domain-containing protein n=1 Tax=Roridomyces roridus TaxID=1738132 RepID=A0AAD7F6R2_9AGAR|nr:hypothetical protein FB45DRAFT_952782 [Roridomyces roridus]
MTEQPSALRRNLTDIEGQISALHSQLARLETDRETILEKLASVVYLVLTIPSEITSEIFLHYLDHYPSSTCSPLVLSRVCSLWRNVALFTPALWSRLHFGFKNSPKADQSVLRLWLSRAASLPLDIRIHLPEPKRVQILRLLGEFSAQCQSLSLKAKGGISVPIGTFRAFPCLEKLELAAYNAEIFNPAAITFSTMLNAPRLRELVLHYSATVDTTLPWSQLTTLRLLDGRSADCIQILQHTPNLELLEFTSMPCEWEGQVTERRFLRHLHTLILRHQEGYEIVNGLALPSLRELRFESQLASCADEMANMLIDSGCTLQVLAFPIEDEADVQSMSLLLRNAKHDKTFPKLFARLFDDPKMLPVLSSLSIINCRSTIPLSPLVKMLKTVTKREPAKLTSFKITFAHGRIEVDGGYMTSGGGPSKDRQVEDLLTQFREMRAAGLEVDIQSNIKWFSEEMNLPMIEEICRPL